MARATSTEHRRVIHPRYDAEAAGHVAVFTGIGAVDVLRVLACRLHAVVTA